MPQFLYATSGDAKVRYLDSGGDDRGAPIIFVPGFTDVADDYVEVLPLLAATRGWSASMSTRPMGSDRPLMPGAIG